MNRQELSFLEKKFFVKRLSDIQAWFAASDIGYFVKPVAVDDLEEYFKENRCVVDRTESNLTVYFYDSFELYMLDFNLTSEGLLHRFGGGSFTEQFYRDRWNDPSLQKFFKYVLNLRGKEKYTSFVAENFSDYGQYLSCSTYFKRPIFKRGVEKEEILAFMHKRPRALAKVLRLRPLLWFILTYITELLKKINQGRVIAFVGVDGSGKTTVISEMQRVLNARVVYMGNYYFVFARFYNWLGSKHLYLARFCFVLKLIEQWGRYCKIRWHTLRGRHVLTDRYPRFNRPLRTTGNLLKMNTALYSWFPQPHGYVFLYAVPSREKQ